MVLMVLMVLMVCVHSTAIAVRCKDGVVFGVEKLVLSKLYEEGSNKRIFNVDKHVGMVTLTLTLTPRSPLPLPDVLFFIMGAPSAGLPDWEGKSVPIWQPWPPEFGGATVGFAILGGGRRIRSSNISMSDQFPLKHRINMAPCCGDIRSQNK